jgi:hypothetical protein
MLLCMYVRFNCITFQTQTAVEEQLKLDQSPHCLRCLRSARNTLVAARATFDETDWYNKPTVNSFLKWLVAKSHVDEKSLSSKCCSDLKTAVDKTSNWDQMFCAEKMEADVKKILTVKYGALLVMYCL